MATRYDTLVSVFRLMDEERATEGRNQDLRRASFTHRDVEDVHLSNNILSVVLKDGRRWEGRPDGLLWSEIQQLLGWSEVKAVEASLELSGPRYGRRQLKKRRSAK